MTKPMDVGELRVGGYMMIDGEPCKIMDITKSKPGKHGSAKARIVAIGVFDGQKRQFVKPVDNGAEVPIIDKRPGQVFAVNPDRCPNYGFRNLRVPRCAFPRRRRCSKSKNSFRRRNRILEDSRQSKNN